MKFYNFNELKIKSYKYITLPYLMNNNRKLITGKSHDLGNNRLLYCTYNVFRLHVTFWRFWQNQFGLSVISISIYV